MSKRFGRNQKRALRQAVEAGQAREAGLQRAYNQLDQRRKEDRQALAYITEILRRVNDDTTLLQPKTIGVRDVEAFKRMEVRAWQDFRAYQPDGPPEYQAVNVSELVHVAHCIERNPATLEHDVHLFIEGPNRRGDQQWRYVIDEKALWRQGIHPGVLREISQRVAQDLVLSLQRAVNAGRR